MPFLEVDAAPGKRVTARVKIGEFLDSSSVELPVAVINGSKDGPTLYVQAGLHGDELTGIAICRAFLRSLDPNAIRGRVVAVPVANVPAHLGRTRGFLHEERWMVDVNRIFPGSTTGLLSERIAAVLFNDFILAADFSVDLHSALAGCNIAPFVYINPDDDENGTLNAREKHGRAFGTTHLFYRARGAKLGTSDMARSISAQADLQGAAMITAEMGESRRTSGHLVDFGVQGLHNVLKSLSMEEGDLVSPPYQTRFQEIAVLHSSRGGGLTYEAELGDTVAAGQRIAFLEGMFGEIVEEFVAPVSGFLLRKMLLGAVASGAEIAWIGH